jgi:tetratricopeptide (TPR) repeat protein
VLGLRGNVIPCIKSNATSILDLLASGSGGRLNTTDLDAIGFSVITSIPPQVVFSSQMRFVFMNAPLSKGKSKACSALLLIAGLLLTISLSRPTAAQTEDAFGETSTDPVKLFEQGQNAHARGDLNKALAFYEEAIKVRPEFPEAEYQRGTVLVSLGRLADAESGFRRAIELKKNWSLPYSALGSLLVRLKRDPEAEPFLRVASKLDGQSSLPLRVLADVRLRAGDVKEALDLAKRATRDPDAPLSTWILVAVAQRADGDNASALASLDHVLKIDPLQLSALIERAEIRLVTGDKERALADLAASEPLVKSDKESATRIAAAYERAGKPEEASRVAKAAGLTQNAKVAANGPSGPGGVIGKPEEIEAANSADAEVARKALEILLQKNPNNALLLARLGDSYRKIDTARSLDFYRRAVQIEPGNADYATGYSAALVQARRFAEAVSILRRVITASPDNYAAHANLATAFYALKLFNDALAEYQWLLAAKPELTITHYFIATAHDNLGEFEEALASYEQFLANANQKTNELEIEKVKLRLPSLRRQIQLGQGVKKNQKARRN